MSEDPTPPAFGNCQAAGPPYGVSSLPGPGSGNNESEFEACIQRKFAYTNSGEAFRGSGKETEGKGTKGK